MTMRSAGYPQLPTIGIAAGIADDLALCHRPRWAVKRIGTAITEKHGFPITAGNEHPIDETSSGTMLYGATKRCVDGCSGFCADIDALMGMTEMILFPKGRGHLASGKRGCCPGRCHEEQQPRDT